MTYSFLNVTFLDFAHTETAENRTTKFFETDEVKYKPAIQIEIAIEVIVERPFRVVTILQLQLLQSNSREPGRKLGRRDQPSAKR